MIGSVVGLRTTAMTRIAVVGLGLIGGSFALAARQAGHAVLAWDADPRTRENAARRGLTVSTDLSSAELIVLAVPLPALTDGLPALLAGVQLSDRATITDVGSVKEPVVAAMRAAGHSNRYIGGHPMAGTERSGFPAASADLFTGARWALCLHDDDSDTQVRRWLEVAAVLTGLGVSVLALTPAEHDAALGMVSGLPHLLALALAASAQQYGPVARTLAAGSFTDLTRVAGTDPLLLHSVTLRNEPAVRAAFRLVNEQLDRPWEELIEAGHTARESLSHDVNAGGLSRTEASAVGAEQLLDLCRGGAVIETVDLDADLIRYRNVTAP
ncbi:MAG: prephenate dehydrogenase/arogenate dehydrogenase family protein [Geodermatophilaceae bacterium]|nr:prephenate dehydrogenase/arogenate dehydrogenase family protein [Geodermatophilaceae bacterium]